MNLSGVWMTESRSMTYMLVPKCACSSIGQIMYYSDHGTFYDGDIHDSQDGLHKWAFKESRPLIFDTVRTRQSYAFSCVRNPYRRILSCFFDKIVGVQRDGNRYRGNLVHEIAPKYGVKVGSVEDDFDFDQIKSFRRFLLFARDTIMWKRPMDPDIHWAPSTQHLQTLIGAGGRLNRVFCTENFNEGMRLVLDEARPAYPIDPAQAPRFNESAAFAPKPAHDVADFFDDLSMHLMREMYGLDFELFNYDIDTPSNPRPSAPIDLEELHVKLQAR